VSQDKPPHVSLIKSVASRPSPAKKCQIRKGGWSKTALLSADSAARLSLPAKTVYSPGAVFRSLAKDSDESDFLELEKQLGYTTDPRHGPVYDTALLLGPIPTQSLTERQNLPYVDSSAEYVSTLEKYLWDSEEKVSRRGLIISGAFPDAQPDEQQHLTDAILAFARAILDRQRLIIFGGHPTFTPLILDIGRRRRPKDFKKAIHLYQSRFVVTDKDLQALQKQATVFSVDAVEADRIASLTRMRQEMINDRQAAGLVAVGGRTKSEQHSPGLDEEIDLALKAKLPVFLIGSAGGVRPKSVPNTSQSIGRAGLINYRRQTMMS